MMQLVCIVLSFSIFGVARSQTTSIASDHGIVSAAGGPAASQTVAYSIEGEGVISATSAILPTPTSVHSSTNDGTVDGSQSTSSNGHGLSPAAVVGIVIAILLAIIAVTMVAIFAHKRKKLAISRAKRKSIMDAEFAASEPNLLQTRTEMTGLDKPQVGYFDIAKPLPVVIAQKPVEEDTLSRSSTIIADAAEVAQLNRKVSVHQTRAKKSREQVRERNHALQILITNADNRTSVLHSPLTSNPTTPISPDAESPTKAHCPDGDGDAFVRHPSKL